MSQEQINIQKILRKITRLKVALFVISFLTIAALIYVYSSESSQPFIGKPKVLNNALLEQEIENGRLSFLIDSLRHSNDLLMQESNRVDGIFFEVQIGAFESFDIEKYHENLQKLNYTTVDGVHYITLAKFRDLEDAKLFTEDIKRIGINNASIVSKLDGKRVQLKD